MWTSQTSFHLFLVNTSANVNGNMNARVTKKNSQATTAPKRTKPNHSPFVTMANSCVQMGLPKTFSIALWKTSKERHSLSWKSCNATICSGVHVFQTSLLANLIASSFDSCFNAQITLLKFPWLEWLFGLRNAPFPSLHLLALLLGTSAYLEPKP